jgi:hypothetical protein
MKYINFDDAMKDSPIPSKDWLNLTSEKRLLIVKKAANNIEGMNITRATDKGYVYLTLEKTMDSGERGALLLRLEELLKRKVDNGITIWHEPIGDKNSLRKLRGIEVKTS